MAPSKEAGQGRYAVVPVSVGGQHMTPSYTAGQYFVIPGGHRKKQST